MSGIASEGWVSDLDAAARASSSLPRVAGGRRVVLQQVVTGGDRELAWWIELTPEGASVHDGRAEHADVTLTGERATVEAISRGRLSAQSAFMTGRLRLGGDVRVLLERRAALASLDDVFAAARARLESEQEQEG